MNPLKITSPCKARIIYMQTSTGENAVPRATAVIQKHPRMNRSLLPYTSASFPKRSRKEPDVKVNAETTHCCRVSGMSNSLVI